MNNLKDNGWVKLHRQFLKWEWYQKSEMVSLFLYLLLSANHEPKKWQGVEIKRGQLVTGLKTLARETGLTPQSLRTCLERLKSTGEITSQSTNKYRLITILKYDDYQQDERKSTSKSTVQPTNNQQSNNKQSTPNNNDNNYKNEKNKYSAFAHVDSEFKILYDSYLEMRKKKRATPTAKAEELILAKLQAQPLSIAKEMLKNSIENNWTGVFIPRSTGMQEHKPDETAKAERERINREHFEKYGVEKLS